MPVIKQAIVIMGTGDVAIGYIKSKYKGRNIQGISFTEITPIGCGEELTDEALNERAMRYPAESIMLGFTDPLAVRVTIAALKRLLVEREEDV